MTWQIIIHLDECMRKPVTADNRVHRRLRMYKVLHGEEIVYHVHTITIFHMLVCTCDV
jgi:hypothetical protein